MTSVRLRWELVGTLVLKLVLLFAIKYAFFPHRLGADEAAKGVAERIAMSAPAESASVTKEKP